MLPLDANSPLLYPDDWLPTDPTEPAGEGVGDNGDGVPCPGCWWPCWSGVIAAVWFWENKIGLGNS